MCIELFRFIISKRKFLGKFNCSELVLAAFENLYFLKLCTGGSRDGTVLFFVEK